MGDSRKKLYISRNDRRKRIVFKINRQCTDELSRYLPRSTIQSQRQCLQIDSVRHTVASSASTTDVSPPEISSSEKSQVPSQLPQSMTRLVPLDSTATLVLLPVKLMSLEGRKQVKSAQVWRDGFYIVATYEMVLEVPGVPSRAVMLGESSLNV